VVDLYMDVSILASGATATGSLYVRGTPLIVHWQWADMKSIGVAESSRGSPEAAVDDAMNVDVRSDRRLRQFTRRLTGDNTQHKIRRNDCYLVPRSEPNRIRSEELN